MFPLNGHEARPSSLHSTCGKTGLVCRTVSKACLYHCKYTFHKEAIRQISYTRPSRALMFTTHVLSNVMTQNDNDCPPAAASARERDVCPILCSKPTPVLPPRVSWSSHPHAWVYSVINVRLGLNWRYILPFSRRDKQAIAGTIYPAGCYGIDPRSSIAANISWKAVSSCPHVIGSQLQHKYI